MKISHGNRSYIIAHIIRRGMLVMIMASLVYSVGGVGAEPIRGQALRAPLDIVPPILQDKKSSHNTRNKSEADKLAPRTIARQSNRAVRSVSSIGDGQGGIQVGRLGTLADAAIGLEAGYGKGIWAGARLAYIEPLLAQLPRTHNLYALRMIERRLLISQATAPQGAAQVINGKASKSWFAARMHRLLILGDMQAVLDLVARTRAERGDAFVRQALVLAHLGHGQIEEACAIAPAKRGDAARLTTRRFFVERSLYCSLYKQDYETAADVLAENEKTLADAVVIKAAALAVIENKPLDESEIVIPSSLSAWDYLTLRLAGYVPPPDTLVPPFLYAVMARDVSLPAALRLQAVRYTLLMGVDYLSATKDIALNQTDEIAPDLAQDFALADLVRRIDEMAQARLYKQMIAIMAEGLGKVRELPQKEMWYDSVLALAPYFKTLPPPKNIYDETAGGARFSVPFFFAATPLTADAAHEIGLAFLFLGDDVSAVQWLERFEVSADLQTLLADISGGVVGAEAAEPSPFQARFASLLEQGRIGEALLSLVNKYGEGLDIETATPLLALFSQDTQLSADAAALLRELLIRKHIENAR